MYKSDYQDFWLEYGVRSLQVYVNTTDPGVNLGNLSDTALVFTGIIPANTFDNGGVKGTDTDVQRVCKGTYVVFDFVDGQSSNSNAYMGVRRIELYGYA